MSVAICILAKNEEKSIGACLRQLAAQSIVRADDDVIDILVVANGCSDDTVGVARSHEALFEGSRTTIHVHDLPQGGKSRAWNRTVHDFARDDVEAFVFVDSDVTLKDDDVLASLLLGLRTGPDLAAFGGFPVKDAVTKSRKTLFDRFSLFVSSRTRHLDVINGSLYAARASALRDVWLPNQIPGEDGFLNAMVCTRGFSRPADPGLVATASQPTHFFHSHRALEFVSHERRMIVGTMLNRWLFEYFWSLKLERPAGEVIREWNEKDPMWVDKFVSERAAKSPWLIPSAILFSRFRRHPDRPYWKYAASLPIAVLATLSTLPPAILANRRLKNAGAAATW
jgi:glycosyltransferase involved in cell wall biosynthesis